MPLKNTSAPQLPVQNLYLENVTNPKQPRSLDGGVTKHSPQHCTNHQSQVCALLKRRFLNSRENGVYSVPGTRFLKVKVGEKVSSNKMFMSSVLWGGTRTDIYL